MKLCMLFIVCFQLTVSAALSQEKKVSLVCKMSPLKSYSGKSSDRRGIVSCLTRTCEKIRPDLYPCFPKSDKRGITRYPLEKWLTWKFENDIIMVSTRDAQVQEEPIKVHGGGH